MTTDTDSREHPDAAQLISIADLMPTLSGADPAMLANVGHYLRGLSDRVKALPVARTGPLRVAAEAVPIDMVLHCPACGLQHVDAPEHRKIGVGVEARCRETWVNPPHRSHLCHGCGHIWRPADVPTNGVAKIKTAGRADSLLATTPPQAEPSIEQQLQNAREDFTTMKALTESGAAEIARLIAELAQALAMCESLATSVQDLANAKAAADEAHAIELADEKAVVDVLRSELQDRLQKQRAAEAELQEVRTDAGPLSYRDVEFQIGDGPREKLFDAPFELMIMCTRVGAWELYGKHISLNERELLAGEYASTPLRLYVAGRQILGASMTKEKP
jgi:hypothetical protein